MIFNYQGGGRKFVALSLCISIVSKALKSTADFLRFKTISHNFCTILGKPVVISEYMPNIGKGNKPIAFGDFSYYWIIPRSKISVRSLVEKFLVYSQVGYLAIKFLDGVLMRKEAIKVLQISE